MGNNGCAMYKQTTKTGKEMKLICLGSSSKGNSYILKANSGKILLIEAGVPYTEVKNAINYKVSEIVGVLLSHSHKDHAGFIKQYQSVEVFAAKETGEEIEILHNFKAVQEFTQFQAGEFSIIPFDVKHDVKCLGYLIHHNECGNVLFVTDCCYLKYKFAGLNNIMIEANYCEDILNRNIAEGKIPVVVKNRTLQSHMSVETCKQALQANDLSRVNTILLLHLSDGNSDEKRFKKEVEQLTGKTVVVADKGMTFNFNKTPFV